MALSAKPRLNKSRGREVSKIDICRFDTNRLRKMTSKQLRKAHVAVGGRHEIPKRDKTRLLVSGFIFNLAMLRQGPNPLSPRSAEAYRRTYKQDPPDETKILAMYRREADRHEREIWDAQAKAGCRIREDELVARDAEREGRPQEAARVRNKGRGVIR